MKFKNVVTGNVLNVTNDKTIGLMSKSEQYVRVNDQPAAQTKKPAGKTPKK